MMDFNEILNGYSDKDEFIARDLLIVELLLNGGLITTEDVNKIFTGDNLMTKINEVKKLRKQAMKQQLEDMKKVKEQLNENKRDV